MDNYNKLIASKEEIDELREVIINANNSLELLEFIDNNYSIENYNNVIKSSLNMIYSSLGFNNISIESLKEIIERTDRIYQNRTEDYFRIFKDSLIAIITDIEEMIEHLDNFDNCYSLELTKEESKKYSIYTSGNYIYPTLENLNKFLDIVNINYKDYINFNENLDFDYSKFNKNIRKFTIKDLNSFKNKLGKKYRFSSLLLDVYDYSQNDIFYYPVNIGNHYLIISHNSKNKNKNYDIIHTEVDINYNVNNFLFIESDKVDNRDIINKYINILKDIKSKIIKISDLTKDLKIIKDKNVSTELIQKVIDFTVRVLYSVHEIIKHSLIRVRNG